MRQKTRGNSGVSRVALSIPMFCVLVMNAAPGEKPAPVASLSKVASTTSLRFLAKTRGIYIGSCVAVGPLQQEPKYAETLAREFNIVTPENAMKFASIHPAPARYTFEGADAIVTFARSHNMQVRGHTLVWHYPTQVPSWVTERGRDREEMMAILRDHIHTVVGHFRGKVRWWDVVNEGIGDDGSLRDTIWLRGIGPDYMELAFHWAHEADPKTRLFYNDYGAEGLNKKSDAIFELVKDLRRRGVPIHGVGLQMHLFGEPPRPQEVAVNMKRLNDLGLEVQITEMDVPIQGMSGTTEEKLAAQARIYRDMLETCLSAKNCTAFVMWGFTDSHSWIPWFTGNPDAPLIFDENYSPKPAYFALADALARR